MSQKHLSFLLILLLLATLLSLWFYPVFTSALGLMTLLSSIAMSIQSIFEKHRQAENSRPKITREIVILLLTLLLVVIVGGIVGLFAGRYAGAYVESRWQGFGMAAGLASAISVSFAIGYAVRWGVGSLAVENMGRTGHKDE